MMTRARTVARLRALVATSRAAEAAMSEPAAKTAAERKAAERERNRAAGFQLAQVWIHPKDYARFRKYVNALNRRRGMVAA